MSLQRVVTKADEQSRFRTAVNWSVRDGDEVVASGVAYGWGEERTRTLGEEAAKVAEAGYVRQVEQQRYMALREYWREQYKASTNLTFFHELENLWLSAIVVNRPDGTPVLSYLLPDDYESVDRYGEGNSPEESVKDAVTRGALLWIEYDLDLWMRRVESHRKAGIPV